MSSVSFVIESIFYKVYHLALREGLPESYIQHFKKSLIAQNGAVYAPTSVFFEMYEIIDKHLDPAFSIRVGQLMELDDYGVLGLAWKTCTSPRDMFIRCERFFQLMTDTTVFKVHDYGELGMITIDREPVRRGIEISNESSIVATTTVINKLIEGEIWPVEVHMKHRTPVSLAPYEAYFKGKVLFEQNQNALLYRSHDLDRRSLKADESINTFFVDRLEEQSKRFEIHPDKLIADATNLIKDYLPSGIPSAGDIGKSLGMSHRTLSRRLSEQGLTFRELVQRIQKDLSMHLLQHSVFSIGEIAFKTGFSEQSAFNRAFKRWTGESPLYFRSNPSLF